MNAFQKVRETLEAHGSKIQDSGPDRFVAQCPSHNDGRPSLSVRSGDRGALLYCFAGCETKQIAVDLGLDQKDLFDSSEIRYDYRDGSGKILRTVVRKPGKGFTHKLGDVVTVSSPELGTLANRMTWTDKAAPWTFGASHLFRNLAKRGLL